MKIFIILLLAGLSAVGVSAQKITGIVKDEQGKNLSSASVLLKRVKDSSVAKIAASNSSGRYEFNNIPAGNYFIGITHVGYAVKSSPAFEVNEAGEVQVPELVLEKRNTNLEGITVTARKPMVEVKADKTILNVEGTINAVGNDALELLRKAPGVLVDKDDNVSLSGKNGVQIYIDGKPSPLSGQDLASFLKSLQSAQIESIEIITNPSAKYDAAGNAGIINIRLKKNQSFGTNGSVNAGYNIGIHGRYNAGIALNHRNKNINVFGNYNFNHGLNANIFKLYRELLDTIFDQNSRMRNRNTNHGFKAGVDYTINKKNSIGLVVNGNVSDPRFSNYSVTPITYKPTGVVDRILVADNKNKMERENVNINLNYRFADTAGHELNIDADHGMFSLRGDQLQPNYYFDPSGTTELSRFIYNFISPTDIDIYTLKADYEQNFKKGKLGFGGKSSLVNTKNNFGRYNVYGNDKELDIARSNQFDYNENINAVYVNYNRPFKGFMIQFGVRMENSNSTGDSYGLNADGSVDYSSKISFERHYTNLFPSAALTFNKNPKSQWGFTYSRRIDRPAYQDLNPFEFKLDEYTFMKGNTQLRPQYTNSYGITHTYNFKLTTKLNYSHVFDVFTQLVDTAETSKSFLTKKNLATQDIVSLNISYPFQYKWYNMFINVNSFYSHYIADFGGGNRIINLDVYSYNVFMQNSFTLGKKEKGWTAELSGFYNSPSLWQGTFKSSAIWSINGGLQKNILKGKGTLKATVTDIFHTQKFSGTSNFSGQYLRVSGSSDSRQLRMSLTYRFGSNQVKAARQRKAGLDEESQRVQQGGGGIGQ